MFGWYCNVGHWEGSMNVNSIEWLDTHRPFVIIDNLPDIDMLDFKTPDAAYGYLSSFIGTGADALYILPYGNSTNIVRFDVGLKPAFPSLEKGYPNSWISYRENNYNYNFITYIPSLKRAFSFNGTYFNIYDVSQDGSLRSIYSKTYFNGPSGFLNYSPSAVEAELLCISNSGTVPSQWIYKSIFLRYDSMYQETRVSSLVRGTNDWRLPHLFDNITSVSPDFEYIPPDNPYEPGGPSGPTDPDLPPGTFDDESDPIPDSPLPTLSAANTGFTRIYNPSQQID